MNNSLTLNVATHKLNITCKFKHSMESNNGSTLPCCKLYTNQWYHLQPWDILIQRFPDHATGLQQDLMFYSKNRLTLSSFKSLKSNSPFLKATQTTTWHSGLALNVSIWLISQKFIFLLHMFCWEKQGEFKLRFILLHDNYRKFVTPLLTIRN